MKRLKGVTKKQWELLLLITPEPGGRGVSITGAAKQLNISRQAAHQRLNNFKNRFPIEYERFNKLRKFRSLIRHNIHYKYPNLHTLRYNDKGRISFEQYIESSQIKKKSFYYNPIKEKF